MLKYTNVALMRISLNIGKLIAYSKQQNACVRESNDEWVLAILDLDPDLAVGAIRRPWTLVIAGEYDEDEEERGEKLHRERLAFGHVTTRYSASGRCSPARDVIARGVGIPPAVRWWRQRRDFPEHECDCGAEDCPGELSGEVEGATSEADTTCRQHGECNGWVDVRVTDHTGAVDSRTVR